MRIPLSDVNCKESSAGKIACNLYSSLNSEIDTASICYEKGAEVNESKSFKFDLD